jgi:hypothetical protein
MTEGEFYRLLVSRVDFSGSEYCRKILDEAAKEFPDHANLNDLDLSPEIIIELNKRVGKPLCEWFKRWFGEEKP